MADGDNNQAGGLTNLNTTQQQGVVYLGKISQVLQKAFVQFGGTTTSATAGAASALPATPAGYVTITLPNGTVGKVPYYN